jgi:hypothetical protein
MTLHGLSWRRVCGLFVLAALSLWRPASGQELIRVGSPLAKRQHPRIWLTQDNIPAYQAKLGGAFRSEYQAWVAYLDSAYDTADTASEYEKQALNFAFVYRVGAVPGISYGHSIADYGTKGKTLFMKAVSAGVGRNVPLAYDWLYDLLSPADRVAAVGAFLALPVPKVTNPLDDGESAERLAYIGAGLAFYGDGVDDTSALAMIEKYYSLQGGAAPIEFHNFVAGDDGGWSQGISYSVHGGSSPWLSLLQLTEAWRTAQGMSEFETYGDLKASTFRFYPQWYAYSILPHAVPSKNGGPDGLLRTLYRTHLMEAAQGVLFGDIQAMLSAARMFSTIDPKMASLAEWMLEQRTGVLPVTGTTGRRFALLGHFIFGRKVAPASPQDVGLPASKLFDRLGWAVMRTDFDANEGSMVTFMGSPWSRAGGAYTNFNQNSFTIDRRGPVVINSGIQPHHGYSNSTWASNTIIFPDPTITPTSDSDRGGQRTSFPEPTRSSVLVPNSAWDLGGVRHFETYSPADGRTYDYVFSDATRAYNGPANADTKNPKKVDLFTRQMVYFRPDSGAEPDQVIIFDRTRTTSTQFEKRWLLHTAAEPMVNGSEVLEREGKWRYSGATMIQATNTANGSSSQLYVHPLLPLARRVVKIGGAGHEFEDPYGLNDINGAKGAMDRQYVGTYRIEIIPDTPALNDVFLTVLEATNVGALATPAARLNGTGMTGARIGNRLAVFSMTESSVTSGSFVVDAPGDYDAVICDLVPRGEYSVAGRTLTASDSGTIHLNLSIVGSGTPVSVSATGSVAPAPATAPAAPSGLKIVASF